MLKRQEVRRGIQSRALPTTTLTLPSHSRSLNSCVGLETIPLAPINVVKRASFYFYKGKTGCVRNFSTTKTVRGLIIS